MFEGPKQIIRYITHFLRLRSKYRIHSPFIFSFYQNILCDKAYNHDFEQIEHIREDLQARHRYIKRVDLGARAVEFPYSQRFVRVKDIARHSSVSPRKGRLLYRMMNYYKPRSVVELGTSFGISTMYLAMGYRNSKVITVEGCTDTLNIAVHNFNRLALSNIDEINGNFDTKLPEILERCGTIDFVFFDGNHKKEATLRYFDECLGHIGNNTIFVFDDIHWSRDMELAWTNIREHPSVRVTVDLFDMGIVFFRKELSKEDFVLNF